MSEKGKDILIQVETAPAVWTTVGCLRTQSISINNEEVDITSTCSEGEFRELLGEAGVRTLNITGNGMFSNGAGQIHMINAAMNGTIESMRFFVPNFGTFMGDFNPTTVEITGEYNGAVQFNGTFGSAGQVTFTAV